jgi:ubiquinone/menaquinone biosynthesis C-methylase UbiE
VCPETTLGNLPLTRMCAAAAIATLVLAQGAVAQAPGVHPVTGRRIATVMSHLGADWLDRPDREREEEPDRAIAALAIAPGSTVADVGAGSGYMTVRLAAAVGPSGRVFATDVQHEMVSRLVARLDAAKIRNVTPVLATPDDPRLPDAALDLVLMVDVYHELSAPQRTLQQLKRTLRPGGRLVLLEYRKEDPAIPIREEHKMTVAEAKAEVEAEGFRLASVIESLPRQHILIFVVASPVAAGL